jgi:ribosomal protein S18 acetylase RimI-like enzyme
MEVRRLIDNDASELWRLRLEALESEPQAFRETAAEHRQRTVAGYAEQLREGGDRSFVFGAVDNGRLVGMVGFYSNKPDQGCIWGMYVAPAYRNTGAGAKLLQSILHQARTIPGIETVHLSVARSQQAARNLYLRCGFRISEEKPTAACGGNLPEDQENMVLDLLQDR